MKHDSTDAADALAMPDEELLGRYLAGELTEQARIAAWFDAHPQMQEAVATVRTAALPPALAADEANRISLTEGFWARVHERSAAPAHRTKQKSKGRFQTGRFRSWMPWGLGAAVATIVVTSVGTMIWPAGSQTDVIPSNTFRTVPGQQATVRLASGVTMHLAPATTVQVHAEGLTLQGEVHFEVTPNSARPLVVTTANAKVQVLGTRFAVRQYVDDAGSRVVVQDGRVALRSLHRSTSGNTPVVLSANMLGQVMDSSVTVTSGVSVDTYLGWMHGQLVFLEIPLRQVAIELARAYGAEIRVPDTLLARRPMTLKASVEKQPLTQVLELIGIATNAHYTRQGDVFTLAPGRVAVRDSQVKQLPQPERLYGR